MWTLGDGNVASGKVVNHKYNAPGTYKVLLQVENDGKRDTTSQIVTLLADPAACLPLTMAGMGLYPGRPNFAGNPDSLTFNYLPDQKLDQIRWWIPKPPTYQNVAKLIYDAEGKIIRIETSIILSGQITAYFIYDDNKRPLRMNVNRVSDPADSLWVAYFKHDQNGHLNHITTRSSYPTPMEAVNVSIRYETDSQGNAVKVYYTYPNQPERLVRDNKVFYDTKPSYASSKELRFFLEYFAVVEPYYKYPKTSFITHARYDPQGTGFANFGQQQPDGSFSGRTIEYELKLSAIGLPQSYMATTVGGNSQHHTSGTYLCK